MITILLIPVFIFLVYLGYPLWLMMQDEQQKCPVANHKKIKNVSLIYLSHNGANFIEEKINFLLNELSGFEHFELIIIDDNSTDQSRELIHRIEDENIRVILKNEQKGIPDSMNTGVREARYEYIVFCDQRQVLTAGIIRRLVEPLLIKRVGAVSSCISQVDKAKRFSPVRALENFVKSQEGKTGNLIGVYGPLYAIKRNCYYDIPSHIILDDLYLTLKILRYKQVWFLQECRVIEEDSAELYDYNRIKRYLQGLLQLTRENKLIGQLREKQIIMLFWHKYLRLFIPLFLFIAYLGLGIMSLGNTGIQIAFFIVTIAGIISLFPGLLKTHFRLQSIIQINIFYLFATIELIFRSVNHHNKFTRMTN